MPLEAMALIAVSGEKLITDMAGQLEKLGRLLEPVDFVNTETHQALPQLLPKLYPVAAEAGDIREAFEATSKRATTLLATYTEVMTMFSKKCLYWDQFLAAAERKLDKAGESLE